MQTPTSLESLPLFQQARQAARPGYEQAVREKAQFLPTPDSRSFAVYQPPKRETKGLVVTLSGHDGWAFQDYVVWQPHLTRFGFGLLTLQWWLGKGEGPQDYFTPSELHKTLTALLSQLKVAPQTALLHGFSRGSTQVYGLTALDHASKSPYYLMTIANAGKAPANYPIINEVARGDYGMRPFEGTHWVLYAGARDPTPERDGIPGMRESRDWIVRLGGTIEKFIEDPNGSHGGFHINRENTRTALEIYEKLLKQKVS